MGRATELALVRGELRAASKGAVRRMVIEGPEGIGKTALLRQVLGGEANVRVLAASGDEAERHLRYGIVRQLADQPWSVLDGTGPASTGAGGSGPGGTGLASTGSTETGPRGAGSRGIGLGKAGLRESGLREAGLRESGLREAGLRGIGLPGTGLRSARLRRSGLAGAATRSGATRSAATRSAAARDLWSVGEALYELVGRLQADGPVVVLVDDAQWADRASLRALGYLLRRLRTGRVLVVVSCRGTAAAWLPDGLRRLLTGEGGLRLVLDGLSAADLAGLTPDPLTERTARRLREHTSGNPLYARELLATVAPTTLADPGARLPAPDAYARPFTRRLRACGAETRALVAACAVLGEPHPLHVVASVAGIVGDPLAALEEAVDAGLLDERPGRFVAFPDPLAGATVYGSLGAGTRARLHLAAARLVEHTGTALRHRAAAAGGPDEQLAEELARYAAKEAQHGLWLDAATHLELAAGLCESAARRDELRTAALRHLLLGGDAVRAAELAAVPNADPRPVRRYILGRLALAAGRLDEAADLLAAAWRNRSPRLAADTAEQLAWLHLVRGNRAAAATWARLAAEQPIQSTTGRPYDVLALSTTGRPFDALAPGMSGRPYDVPAESTSHRPHGVLAPSTAGQFDVPALGAAGQPFDVPVSSTGALGGGPAAEGIPAAVGFLREGEAGAAVSVLVRAVAARDEVGLPHHRLVGGALLAVAEHCEGRWADAVTRAERALAEAEGLGQRWLLPTLHVVCVAPLAALGEHERALAHATAARAIARCQRNVMGESQADLALGLLGAGAGADAGAGAGATPAGADDPFVPDHRPQLIETLVAEGRLDEAEAELATLPGDGARARARRARLSGLLLAARNVPTEAEESFTAALSLLEGTGCPLEEARVLLDLGRLLRRTGRRRAAAARLRAAEAVFTRLGARPLVAGCAQELEACGLEQQGTVRLGLTPQEYSTARLVSDGLTNRQIARELLISVKTVEYHLGKIYTKLGIGSRVALAAKLATLEESA
ncbi:AAA family ATPase [Nonomuraea sp. NPDC049750]|uniref:helix-turn-helix transcriptional regulator n=1 Tax=Nonomuraea sp. NPDC049750 TaxID=3154738 RepID=UPI0033E90E73